MYFNSCIVFPHLSMYITHHVNLVLLVIGYFSHVVCPSNSLFCPVLCRHTGRVCSRYFVRRFRRYWVVQHYGKWADLAYPASTYPAFACGVGNVLSKDLVGWMADNAQVLNAYQVSCACACVCFSSCPTSNGDVASNVKLR